MCGGGGGRGGKEEKERGRETDRQREGREIGSELNTFLTNYCGC